MTSMSVALDPFPYLHLRPARGWVNDPNGIGRWDGRWHVFYQHNPDVPRHEDICWGYASSEDLLTWRHEPVALTPRPGSIDAAGVWSGVSTTDDGEPVLVYTAVPHTAADAGVALAHRDSAGGWLAEETMVAPRPVDPTIRSVRDPFLFTVGGRRFAILGGGRTDGTPVVLVYAVDDLHHWVLLGDLVSGDDPVALDLAPAQIWECPQLAQVRTESGETRWVLIVSLWHGRDERRLRGVAALIGDLDVSSGRPVFSTTGGQPLDHGPDFYAPQAFVDGERTLIWGWTWESTTDRTAHEVEEAGWAGALTLPREITLRGGQVVSSPASELTGLRRSSLTSASLAALDLPAWEAECDGALEVALVSDDDARVVWRSPGGASAVRVIVDGSVVEAFADGAAHTVRAYPRPGEVWSVRSLEEAGTVSAWELGLPTPAG